MQVSRAENAFEVASIELKYAFFTIVTVFDLVKPDQKEL
jgi:hypothetical protein